MSKARKAVILFAITAMVCTLPLAAQFVQEGPDGFGGSGSNTSRATASIFGTDLDDYMDYHGWSGISLNKWFGFVAMDQANGMGMLQNPAYKTPINKVSLGYAQKIGSVYLGAWYSGNIVQVSNWNTPFERSSVSATYDPLSQIMLTKTTTTEYEESYRNATNQIEFFVGVAGQGIRVGYFHSAATDKRSQEVPYIVVQNFDTGVTSYEGKTSEYANSVGYYVPYLGWGSVFKAGEFAIKPYLTFALGIYSNKYANVFRPNYTTYQGNLQGDYVKNIDGSSYGYIKPTLSVGADLDLPQKGILSMTAGIGYDMGVWAYDNKYDDSGFSGETKGTAAWTGSNTVSVGALNTTTTSATELDIADITRSSHVITPTFKIGFAIEDNLKLGAKVWLPIGITVGTTDRYTDERTIVKIVHSGSALPEANTTTTTRTHTPNGMEETTQFSIDPKIGVGASYALIPSRLTINAGITVRPIAFRREVTKISPNGETTTTTSVVDGNGATTSSTITASPNTTTADTVEHTDTWVPFGGEISAGFALSLGSRISLDFEAGVPFGGADGSNALDNSFGKENFSFDLTRLNILFTLQF